MRVMILGLRAVSGVQGGIEAHVRDLLIAIERLGGSGIDFEVVERSSYVTPARAIPPELGAVRLTSLWSPRSAYLEAFIHSALGVLYAAVKRPDVIHIHGIGPGIMVPLAKLFGLRVLVTHHGEDYAREKWGSLARTVLRLGEYCAARFSDERIVIAPSLDDKLAARFGREFRFIPNGIHPPRRSGAAKVLGRWGLARGRYVVHVGRFVPEKRQTDLIAAFARVSAPDWRLVLVGGSDHTSDFAIQTESEAAADHRVILTGVIDRSEVSELLEHAGAFALPSTHEGLPIALLEAMSHELPVLVSNLPNLVALGLPETCYVPMRDVEELAKRLAEIVNRPGVDPIRVDWSPWLVRYSMDSIAARTVKTYFDCARIVANGPGLRNPDSGNGAS